MLTQGDFNDCIAYEAVRHCMQPTFEHELTVGFNNIADACKTHTTYDHTSWLKSLAVLDSFADAWDGDGFDLLHKIKFLDDATNKQEILGRLEKMMLEENQVKAIVLPELCEFLRDQLK